MRISLKVSVGYKHNIEVLSYDEIPARPDLLLRKISFIDFSCKTLVVYLKNAGNLNNFYEELIEVSTHQIFDIILCDFTINTQEPNSQVLQMLTNYNQVVKESTQILGGLLDHFIHS